jgi:Zn-dependent protease with chaperone function
MENSLPSPVDEKRRLNPFAFPAETDFRFWLLVLAVLGASLFTFEHLYFSVPANQAHYFEVAARCLAESPALPETLSLSVLTEMGGLSHCFAAAHRTIAGWVMAGLALETTLALVLYGFYPTWKIRKEKLEPLVLEDTPEIGETLAELCHTAGLKKPPIFLWNPLNLTPGGVAFGRLGKYRVAISGGLVTLFYTDLPAFKAVVLHELAHIRNKDIDKTYLTVSVWRAFVLTALLPLGISFFGRSAGEIFRVGWRAAVLALLVYLIRNAVLRTREVYADLRASSWGETGQALEQMLARLGKPEKSKFKALMQVHPDPSYRREILKDPAPLFRMNFWDSLATGIAASISFLSLEALAYGFLPGSTLLPSLIAASLLASLAAGVVGLEVWRAVYASHVLRGPLGSLLPAGLGLGLGIWMGRNMSFLRFIDNSSAELSLLDHALRMAFTLAWLGALLAGLLLWLSWVASGASIWLPITARLRSPRKITAAGLLIAGLVLVVWLGSLMFLAKFDNSSEGIMGALLVAILSIPSTVAGSPLTLLVLVSLWAFPLSAWFWRRQAAPVSEAGWAFLDAIPDSEKRSLTLPLNPLTALGAGITGAAMFCLMYLVLRIGLRVGVAEAVWESDAFILLLAYGATLAAVLVQVIVAAVVAIWMRGFGLPHGLLAAFVSGSASATGYLGINWLLGGTIDAAIAWNAYSQVVNIGAIAAIPVMTLASFSSKVLFPSVMKNKPASGRTTLSRL